MANLIRKMCQGDVTEVSEIEKCCFSEPWTQKDYETALKNENTLYLVALSEKEQKILGMCGVMNILGEGDISNVAVLPEYRSRGIAKEMLIRLMQDAQQMGVEAFTLEVRSANPAAVHLYESLGFVTEGIRKNFYRMPTDDALIMWRR